MTEDPSSTPKDVQLMEKARQIVETRSRPTAWEDDIGGLEDRGGDDPFRALIQDRASKRNLTLGPDQALELAYGYDELRGNLGLPDEDPTIPHGDLIDLFLERELLPESPAQAAEPAGQISRVQELFGQLRDAYKPEGRAGEPAGDADRRTREIHLEISRALNLEEEEGIEAIIKEEARGVMLSQSKGDTILAAIIKSEQSFSPQALFPQSERLQQAYARLVPAYKEHRVSGHVDDSGYNNSRNAFLNALDEAAGIDRSEIDKLLQDSENAKVSFRHLLRNIIEEKIPDEKIPGLAQTFSKKVGNEIAYLRAVNNRRVGRLELLISAAQRAGARLDTYMLEELKSAGVSIREAVEPLKPPQLALEFSSESLQGKSHRRNEDERFIDPAHGLAMVFDGVSLPSNGKEAAVAARDFLSRARQLTAPQDPQAMESGIRDILIEASKYVLATEGSTTAVVVRFFPKDDMVMTVIGWVGDSRAYVFRAKESKLEKLTEDHDPIWNNLKDGEFPREQRERIREMLATVPYRRLIDPDGKPIPDPEAERDFVDKLVNAGIILESDRELIIPYNFVRWKPAVSQYLGGRVENRGMCNPAVLTAQLREGDKMILVTDGVYKSFTPAELEIVVRRTQTGLAKDLVEQAKSNWGGDDMTVAVVEVKKRTGAYFIRPEINRRWLADLSSETTTRYREALSRKGQTITPVASGIWLLADGITYRLGEEEDRVHTNLEQLEMSRRLAYTGNYARQGGLVAFINEDGELFVGRDTAENLQALQIAGYKENPLVNVPLSHGEEIIDEKIREQFSSLF